MRNPFFSLDLSHMRVEHLPENCKVSLNCGNNCFVSLPIGINIIDWYNVNLSL
jgi:hypothetical protein